VDLTIDAGRIDLWCAFVSDVRDEALWSRYDALLSPAERVRQSRLRFARDRRRHLLTRALVRSVLSRYAPCAPQQWEFAADAAGRPRIAGPEPSPPIEFNISHASDVVAVAVASARRLGVDVENFAARDTDIEGLHRYFTPAESASLLALPQDSRRRRFFELWTLKECYLKARGVGLAVSLGAFGFDLTAERSVRLSMDPELGDSPERWQLWQLTLRSDYLAALCAERGDAPRVQVRVREAVPLAFEQEVEPSICRSTETA
jgi:4'-phosphopantetheinyl transferase